MDGECAHADNVGYLQRPSERVKQESSTDPPALRVAINGKSGEYEKRYRMPRHSFHNALGRVCVPHLSGYERVKSKNFAVAHRDIGLR